MIMPATPPQFRSPSSAALFFATIRPQHIKKVSSKRSSCELFFGQLQVSLVLGQHTRHAAFQAART